MSNYFEFSTLDQSMSLNVFQNAFSSYQAMSSMLKTHTYNEILECASSLTGIEQKKLDQYPMGNYYKGTINETYHSVLQELLKNICQYDWLYSHLKDNISRTVFTNLVGYRLLPIKTFLRSACDEKYPPYFDKDFISCTKDEVFVDCGASFGDTSEEFIRQFDNYKHIYAYEPSQNNIQICRDNLRKYHKVTVRECAIGEKRTHSENVQIVSLDEDIQEPITFIKIDTNGFEVPALLGSKRHIQNDFPKLAVCANHIVCGIWEIPRLIDTIHSDYRFFIRNYETSQNWNTIIYAVPPEETKKHQIVKSVKRTKRIVSPALGEGWTNAQLVKDCGVIPYLFYKNHQCDACMLGIKDTIPYFNAKYVKGLKLEFLPDSELRTKAEWIVKEAPSIDCLQLYGCYTEYSPLVNLYKKVNPKGKVSLALDANSLWMDRIQLNPVFNHFMDQCDVISTAGRAMQKYLNEKWPWTIEYIPNGFYNFSSKAWNIDFEKKENIILAVGRLGTLQKATHILLESFARIEKMIPEWKLYLIGTIEPEFKSYLAQFLINFPNLYHRIQFLGNITDRDTLYAEYQRSKIFALTSVWEGGTPNVIAEALYAGNAIAITKIDEYQDATDNGYCGLVSDIDDISGFSDILLRLCLDENLEKKCRHAYNYAQQNFDMEKAVAKLYYLIFGEETSI